MLLFLVWPSSPGSSDMVRVVRQVRGGNTPCLKGIMAVLALWGAGGRRQEAGGRRQEAESNR